MRRCTDPRMRLYHTSRRHRGETATIVGLLVSTAISIALSAAAYYAMPRRGAKKQHGNKEEYGITNIAVQGAYIPLLIGRKRIGCVFGWAGDRSAFVSRQRVKRGKGIWIHYLVQGLDGAGYTKQVPDGRILFSEAGVHWLCVGPARRIHRIWSAGEVIYPSGNYIDPIDSDTSPSGSTFTISHGTFRVFWGERTQPINTFLSAASRLGVASRWPHVCYIEWNKKDLGESPYWPQLEYDVEVEPQTDDSGIGGAVATIPPFKEVAGPPAYEGVLAPYALTQVLFESYPHGIGLDVADFDYTDGGGIDDTDLLLYLPFNTSGDWLEDKSGNSRDVVLTDPGTAFSSDGLIDGAADLTGVHSDHSYLWRGTGVDDSVFDFGANPFTISFWVKHDEADDGVHPEECYIEKFHGNSGPGWTIYRKNNKIEFYSSGGPWFGGIGSTVTPGVWHHIVVRRAGTTATIWLDGVVQDTQVTAGVITDTSEPLRIGYRNEFDGRDAHFGGLMDEIAIWGRAVSDAEIAAIFNDGDGTRIGEPSGTLWELIQLADEENYVATLHAQDGEEVNNILGVLLQDMGAMIPRVCDGRIGFAPLRQVEAADVVILDRDQPLPPEFELETLRIERHVDRAMFSFQDESRNYRDTVLQIDDDGQAIQGGNVRGQVLPIATITKREVAIPVAHRRAQEELAGAGRVTAFLARGAHRIIPGMVISIPGVEDVARVIEVEISDSTGRAKVDAVLDFYGAPAVTFTPVEAPIPTSTGAIPAVANLEATFWEVPEHAGSIGLVQVLPLRIRGSTLMLSQINHVSNDGTSYEGAGGDGSIHSGGTLLEAIGASDAWEYDTGPTITLEGDSGDLLDYIDDLSTDEASWRAGRQCVLIGEELFYVMRVFAVGGTTYRLDGLIRARLDTVRAAHAVGDVVFIFALSETTPVSGPEVYPAATLYLKQQPITGGSAYDLTLISPTTKTLKGKGITPMTPGAFRVTAPALGSCTYPTGSDIDFAWSYRSSQYPKTGAGMQPFGTAVGSSAMVGTFEAKIYNSAGTLVATHALGAVDEWTYTAAQLALDFGVEPSSFQVEVRNVNGGWRSDPSERLTLERI